MNNNKIEDDFEEIHDNLYEEIESIKNSLDNFSISSNLISGMYIPSSQYIYPYPYQNSSITNYSINPYKDSYEQFLFNLTNIKDRRENKITQISLENIKNVIEITHKFITFDYIENYTNDVYGNNFEDIDIFDIPDVEIYTINKKFSSVIIDMSIYRKIKKLDYSFVIDVVNNKLYIMFDDEKDLAKFKIQYSGV